MAGAAAHGQAHRVRRQGACRLARGPGRAAHPPAGPGHGLPHPARHRRRPVLQRHRRRPDARRARALRSPTARTSSSTPSRSSSRGAAASRWRRRPAPGRRRGAARPAGAPASRPRRRGPVRRRPQAARCRSCRASSGLVCGRASAAERDVVENARRRWPGVRFDVRAVAVQGPNGVPEVIAALAALDAEPEVDVIVVARGGGSLEDLLPFSNEALLRAVAACRTPVVSAIGHEVDTPLLDLVADVRASTPTDAAKRIVPDVAEELAGWRRRGRSRRRAVLRPARAGGAAARRPAIAARRSPTRARVLAAPRRPGRGPASARRERQSRRPRCDRGARRRRRTCANGSRHLSPAATLARGYAVRRRTPRARSLRRPGARWTPATAAACPRLHGGERGRRSAGREGGDVTESDRSPRATSTPSGTSRPGTRSSTWSAGSRPAAPRWRSRSPCGSAARRSPARCEQWLAGARARVEAAPPRGPQPG